VIEEIPEVVSASKPNGASMANPMSWNIPLSA
jgi:hypothetical protein